MFFQAVKLFHPFIRVFPDVSGMDFRNKTTRGDEFAPQNSGYMEKRNWSIT